MGLSKREQVADAQRETRERIRLRRIRRRRELKCFFTRPFGHHYSDGRCVYCGHIFYAG